VLEHQHLLAKARNDTARVALRVKRKKTDQAGEDMAIPVFRMSVISRGGGSSAVGSSAYASGSKMTSAIASAAYRSGETLHDDRTDKTFNYSSKEDIIHSEIMTPADAPEWMQDREKLWNGVEANEKRKDAQLARSLIAALPRELSMEQNMAFVQDFVQAEFVSKGMVADVAIHDKEASDGGRHPHLHVMLTMREVEDDGFAQKKNREWNSTAQLKDWRTAWGEMQNRYIEAAGGAGDLSMASYKDREIDKQPQLHVGPKLRKKEHRESQLRKVDKNHVIEHRNVVKVAATEWQPEYTAKDEADYYRKLHGEQVKTYVPRGAYRDAKVEQVRRLEKAQAVLDQYYAGVTGQTDTRWFGLGGKTTRMQFPAMPGMWRAVYDAQATPEKIQADWEMENQRGREPVEQHRGVVAQFIHADQSGAKTEAVEQFQRTVQRMADKVQEIGQSVLDRYTDWTQSQPQIDRDYGRDRDRGYER